MVQVPVSAHFLVEGGGGLSHRNFLLVPVFSCLPSRSTSGRPCMVLQVPSFDIHPHDHSTSLPALQIGKNLRLSHMNQEAVSRPRRGSSGNFCLEPRSSRVESNLQFGLRIRVGQSRSIASGTPIVPVNVDRSNFGDRSDSGRQGLRLGDGSVWDIFPGASAPDGFAVALFLPMELGNSRLPDMPGTGENTLQSGRRRWRSRVQTTIRFA